MEEIDFEVIDKNTIDSYLYEMNSGFLDKDSEKVISRQLFDHVDMIFIDGDAVTLPWFQRARKVTSTQFLIMIRMCKKTGKVLFGCGFAMQMLAFLCATNLFVNRVVNGNGKGTLLKHFSKVPKAVLGQLEHGDLFLDNATGDLYAYDQVKGEYYPIANCAIHNHKAAQEDLSARQYREFLVPCSNSWDIHPVNSADTDNIYQIFAESQRGPMVIMLKNTVCMQFHIHPKYPETLLLLRNFVEFMSKKIYSEKIRMDVPLSVVSISGYSRPVMKAPPAITQRVVSSGHHSIPFSTARHSGYAFSKRGGPVLVMNNATTVNTVKAAGFEPMLETDSSEDSSRSYELKKKKSWAKSIERLSPRSRSPDRQSTKKTIEEDTFKPMPLPCHQTNLTWSKEEIREFLHPGYPIETMPKVQSAAERSKSALNSSRSKGVVKYVNSPFPYCRYKHFQTSSLAPITVTASQNTKSEPSQVTERPLIEDSRRINKSKWISDSDFHLTFRSSSRKEVKAPFNLEPLCIKLRNQFRETNREKWVGGAFKS